MSIFLVIASIIFLCTSVYLVYQAYSEKTKATDDIGKLRAKNVFQKNIGYGLICLAIGNLLDISVPFPFPFVGPVSIYFSVLTLIGGSILLFNHSKPKIDDALSLAEKTEGLLTVAAMMVKLGISQDLAEKTLYEMTKAKLALAIHTDKKEYAERIFLVKSFDKRRGDYNIPDETDEQKRAKYNDVSLDETNRKIIGSTKPNMRNR